MNERSKLVWLGSGFAILTAALVWTGIPLQTTEAPLGIVSLQLAGSGETAAQILAGWGPSGRVAAEVNLIIDFPYLVIYAALLAQLCGRPVAAPGLAVIGRICARAAWSAAACDALENVALLAQLHGAAHDAAAMLAFGFASVKFALLAAVLAYLLTNTVLRQLRQ